MKKYICFLIAISLLVVSNSCLEEEPRAQLYEDEIYKSASDIYVNAVAVLYNYIGGAADSEGLQGTCRGFTIIIR